MTNPCVQESTIKIMDKKLDKMDSKLDLLLATHWKKEGSKTLLLSILAFLVSIAGFLKK